MAVHVKTHRARATKADSKPSRTGSIASTSGAAGTPQKQTTSVKAAYTCRKTRAEAVAAGAAAAAGCGGGGGGGSGGGEAPLGGKGRADGFEKEDVREGSACGCVRHLGYSACVSVTSVDEMMRHRCVSVTSSTDDETPPRLCVRDTSATLCHDRHLSN